MLLSVGTVCYKNVTWARKGFVTIWRNIEKCGLIWFDAARPRVFSGRLDSPSAWHCNLQPLSAASRTRTPPAWISSVLVVSHSSHWCIFTTSFPSLWSLKWAQRRERVRVSGAAAGFAATMRNKEDASSKIGSSKLILSSWKFSCLLAAAPRLRKHRHRRRSGCNLIVFLLLLGPHLL